MSDASIDIWTNEKCIQLIREYRARPCLWDPEDTLHFKNSMKSAMWNDISQVLKVNPEACKRKMNVLMSSFRREKAKLINSISRQKTDKPVRNYTSTWFAFKEMMFMLDKESERKRQTKGVSDCEEFPNVKLILSKQDIQTHSRTKKKNAKIDNEIPLKTTRQPVRAETTTLESTPGSSQTLSDRDEEIKFFTSFIGNKMKRYTDVTKNAVQQAICDIIFQADQNYYETSVNKYPLIDKNPLEKIIFDEDTCVMNDVIKEQPLSDSD